MVDLGGFCFFFSLQAENFQVKFHRDGMCLGEEYESKDKI